MFTGIVRELGRVVAFDGARLLVKAPRTPAGVGDSIAVDGVCLTVVGSGVDGGKTWFDVDAGAETLRMTAAKSWGKGQKLNLERALKIGDELGGHIVAGHVDGIATIIARDDLPEMAKFDLRAPRDLAKFIAAKGSVTLDGVSLTVNTAIGDVFSVTIFPHTLHVTTLGDWRVGREINLEIDLMARYAARLGEMK